MFAKDWKLKRGRGQRLQLAVVKQSRDRLVSQPHSSHPKQQVILRSPSVPKQQPFLNLLYCSYPFVVALSQSSQRLHGNLISQNHLCTFSTSILTSIVPAFVWETAKTFHRLYATTMFAIPLFALKDLSHSWASLLDRLGPQIKPKD